MTTLSKRRSMAAWFAQEAENVQRKIDYYAKTSNYPERIKDLTFRKECYEAAAKALGRGSMLAEAIRDIESED